MTHKVILLPVKFKDKILRKCVDTGNKFRNSVNSLLNEIKKNEFPEEQFRKSLKKFKNDWYRFVYKSFPDKYYSESICEVVYEIGKSLLEISRIYMEESCSREDWFYTKLNEVELKDWIMFECRGDMYQKGNLNIRVEEVYENNVQVRLKVWNGNDFEYIYVTALKPKSRLHFEILKHVYELAENKELGYNARVYVNEYGKFVGYGSIQITVPEDVYVKFYRQKYELYVNKFFGSIGFDVGYDHVAWCLIDTQYNPIEWNVIEFPHLVSQGRKRKDAITYVIKELHKLLNYTVLKYGKVIISVEDPKLLGIYKLQWIKSGTRLQPHYNFKVMMFKSRIAEKIIETSIKHGLNYEKVYPRGTTHSEEHEEIMKKCRMNRHEASAYIIAKRGLEKLKQVI